MVPIALRCMKGDFNQTLRIIHAFYHSFNHFITSKEPNVKIMDYKKLIEKYAAGYADLKKQLDEVPEEAIDFKPSEDAWSIREIVLHLTDSEAHAWVRGRKTVAESGTEICVYDQNVWVKELFYAQSDHEDALELFRLLRKNMASLLEKLPEETWHRYVIHPKTGKIKLYDWVILYTDHVASHIIQIHKNLYEYFKSREK